MKDEAGVDEDIDHDEDYDQYSDGDVDSQCGGESLSRDDTDLDTEDDVNKMSDLEADISSRSRHSHGSSKRKKQKQRPPPLDLGSAAAPAQPTFTPPPPPPPLEEKNPTHPTTNTNDTNNKKRNAMTRENVLAATAGANNIEKAESSDFYPDIDTSSSEDCSHCLCCSSVASYGGRSWKFMEKSQSSAMEYDSDSSEYVTDSDEEEALASTSSMPIHKRLSPFFYQDCYAEVEEEVPGGPDGESDELVLGEDRGEEEAKVSAPPKKRMSPLGCESPKSSRSGGSSQAEEQVDSKERMCAPANKAVAKNSKSVPKGNTKGKKEPKKDVAKSIEASRASDAKSDVVVDKTTNDDDDDEYVPANIKDRLKLFEANNETENLRGRCFQKDSNVGGQTGTQRSVKPEQQWSPPSVVKPKPPPTKAKPQRPSSVQDSLAPPTMQDNVPGNTPVDNKKKDAAPRHVSKSTFRVQTPQDGAKKKKPRPNSTIEIPVQYLQPGNHGLTASAMQGGGITMFGGGVEGDSNQLTFQVRPADPNALNGPLIITSSPKQRRAVSKKVVKLTSCSDDGNDANSNDDVSDSTLRPEPIGGTRPKVHTEESHGDQQQPQHHEICPHCHKKSVPAEERKRNVQVLQLQPVSEVGLPSSPTTPTPQTASVTFTPAPAATAAHFHQQQQLQMHPGARIIKIVPSGRQQLIMQRQPSEEPRSVHLRLNMGGAQGVPIRIGDYIRIPMQPGQARGVRVVFN